MSNEKTVTIIVSAVIPEDNQEEGVVQWISIILLVMINVQFEADHHRKDQLGTSTHLFLDVVF